MAMENLVFLSIVKDELQNAGVSEVPAVGEFILGSANPELFPGGVYGFFVELQPDEATAFYNEASERNAAFIKSREAFKPIKDNFYPIYWGKDKSIGKRPYEHIKNPKGTGAIRLSTYRTLIGKKIYNFTVVVNDSERLERYLQNKFPHLLLTKTAQYISN